MKGAAVSGNGQAASKNISAQAPASGPGSVEEALEQASLSRGDGHLDAAEALYRYILKEDPQNAEAQKALHNLRKSEKKSARKGGRRRKRKSRPASTAPAKLPERQPDQADVQAVIALYIAGRLDKAEAKTLQLLEKFPRAFALYNLLGAVQAGSGKIEEAVASYVQAIAIEPDFANAHNQLGEIYGQSGMLEKASTSFREALRINPDIPEAHNNLGNVLKDLGRLEDAVASYDRAIRIKPDYATAYSNLGAALTDLGRFTEAIASCGQALKIKPDYTNALSGFAAALQHVPNMDGLADFKDLIVRCLESSVIGSYMVRQASHGLLKSGLRKFGATDAVSSHDLAELDPSTGGLLVAHLKHTLIADTDLEIFLGAVRCKFLDLWNKDGHEGLAKEAALRLLEAFAYQGFLNEYVWQVTDDENSSLDTLEAEISEGIRGGVSPGEFDLYLLAAYRPLSAIESIGCWALEHHGEAEAGLKGFLEYVVLNREIEREIAQQMERLTSIDDDVSVAVRDQYEENPYPRWDSLSISKPRPCMEQILKAIAPHRPVLEPVSPAPDILIAGCGTGQHPISTAVGYQHSNVLAVDLSRTSLAFAKRKAEELKVPNIRFAQADILKLEQLEDSFDIIECGGVLHHLADPEAGLRVLLGLLKPGGYMQIGLYSETARRHIRQWREIVSEKKFEPTLQGMRDFRAWVRASDSSDAMTIRKSTDFYSASALRDLVFHIQEHRFTVPQISALLDRHKLDFLGFNFANPRFKAEYSKRFPNDPDCLDLENWHGFEQENPRLFAAMYQFWCRKGA